MAMENPKVNKEDSEQNVSRIQANKPSFYKLLSLAKPEWTMLFAAFILMVGSEATGLYNPLLLADAYNYLVNPSLDSSTRMSEINSVMILVLVIHFAGVLGNFINASIMAAVGERVVSRLRNELYASILKQEIAFFDEHKTGELVSRLGSDTTLLQQGTSQALPEVVLGITKLCVSIGLMFWISPQLAGVTIGTVFCLVIICVPFGHRIGKLSKTYQDILGQAQTHATEALGAMRTVQSFASEDREKIRYRKVIGDPAEFRLWWPNGEKTTYKVGFYKAIANSGFYSLIFGVGFGSMYVSLWFGFKLVNDGQISLGDLTAFQSYIFQIGASLGQTSRFMSQLIEAQGASGRIFYLLERVPTIPGPTPPKRLDEETPQPGIISTSSMNGVVSFNNVDFAYPSRPDIVVLKNFSLEIPSNTTCALVGPSGAGKSTVVALMQRFYDITGGSISIDGHDIRDLDLSWLRSNIGYVQQEPQLFGLSVRENITYGVDREVGEDELDVVCRKANAYDFVMKWPKRYDTLVGERGVKLSGGQKQRLAIARALLVDPKILLLDEATSSLDAESEHLVQEAINKAVVGRTVLIVAHRLSTIQNANQIVVIDNHQMVDVGSHSILMSRCKKYQDLIKRQSLVGELPIPDNAII